MRNCVHSRRIAGAGPGGKAPQCRQRDAGSQKTCAGPRRSGTLQRVRTCGFHTAPGGRPVRSSGLEKRMRTFLPRSALRRIPAWIVPGSFSWARGWYYRLRRQEKSNSDAHPIRIAFRICVTLWESPSPRRPRPAAAPRSPGRSPRQPRCDHESWKEVDSSRLTHPAPVAGRNTHRGSSCRRPIS